MSDSVNTYFGWALFAGVVGLGFSSLSGKYYHADKHEHLEHPGYVIEVEDSGGEVDTGPSLATLLSEADVSKGEKTFAKCGACHSIEQGGSDGIGPNLFGILGKGMGQQSAGFAYSSDLSGMGDTWTYENMDTWLASPRAMISGTKMSFNGLSKGEDRASLMLYMRGLGGGPELPTPEVVEDIEVAESEEGAEGAEEVLADADASPDAIADALEETAAH